MKVFTHRAGTCFLLLLTVAPLFYTICLHLKQHAIRQRMRDRMEKTTLRSITLNEDNINWTRAGKEAWIDGRLFDIKERHCENGVCVLTGSFDDEETALVLQLQKHQREHNDADDEVLTQLFELLQDIYKYPVNDACFLFLENERNYPGMKSSLSSVYMTILTPPPQV